MRLLKTPFRPFHLSLLEWQTNAIKFVLWVKFKPNERPEWHEKKNLVLWSGICGVVSCLDLCHQLQQTATATAAKL